MGQAEVLKQLEKNLEKLQKHLKKTNDIDKQLEIIWENSLKKEDFINVLGVSLKSVSVSLRKLIIQDKIVELKQEQNKVKKKWMIKNDDIIHMVNNRRD